MENNKKKIRLRFQNGLSFESGMKEILFNMKSLYDFEEDNKKPQVIIFGPYGMDIPKPGNYIRVGYFCENIKPRFDICEWAFGIPEYSEFNLDKYCKIQWHGLDPRIFINRENNSNDNKENSKKYFCNFIYSASIPHREFFFRELSKYKFVHSPGKSMNNCENFDNQFKGSQWERKRLYLEQFRFTIAFENYSYPGYQTEKLYDAIRANTIPIYFGDPNFFKIFNKMRIINIYDYLETDEMLYFKLIEPYLQKKFFGGPINKHDIYNRITEKIKEKGRIYKMNLIMKKTTKKVIEKIIEINEDETKYKNMINLPILNKEFQFQLENKIDSQFFQWNKIFQSV